MTDRKPEGKVQAQLRIERLRQSIRPIQYTRKIYPDELRALGVRLARSLGLRIAAYVMNVEESTIRSWIKRFD